MTNQSAKNQCLAALVVAMLSIGYGINCGWASPAIFLLTSDETPLPSGEITMKEASWIASLLAVGGLLGNMVYGFLIKHFGRKGPLISLSIPTIASWMLILYSQNVYYLYAARILHGVTAGGVVVVAPVYLLEIANDRIRGALASTVMLSSHSGIMFAFILGNYCDFYTTPKIVIGLTILFAILFSFFPETPTTLMKRKNLSSAEKSTRFYQNIRQTAEDCVLLHSEMEKLKNSIDGDKTEDYDTSSIKWSDLVTKRGRKAMTIGIVLSLLNQFSGCFAMLSYTASIFKEAGSAMTPNKSAIFVGVIQVVATFALILLIDRAGRKLLYVVSTVGVALGMITLGVYMMLKSWNYDVTPVNWIPIASFSFSIFVASLGILTLPFTVIAEVMPKKLKEFGVTFCMGLISVGAFLMLKCLPLLNDSLGFHGSMFLFAGVCLSSAMYIILFMPETKGRSYEEIMKLL